MRHIGILGGTFDPVHKGHLLLGEQAYREYGLDEIWFMPSHIPPHKKDHSITDGKVRLHMLSLATKDIPYFKVSDFEMKREGNTYTAETLKLLRKAYPDIEIYFIIGADSLYQLETWYHPEKVMEQAILLVSTRSYEDETLSLEEEVSRLCRMYGADIRILHNPRIDKASADIRKKVSAGRDIQSDVPASVADFIKANGLYLVKK